MYRYLWCFKKDKFNTIKKEVLRCFKLFLFFNNSSVKFDFHPHLYFTKGGLEVRNRDTEIPDRSQSPVDKVCCWHPAPEEWTEAAAITEHWIPAGGQQEDVTAGTTLQRTPGGTEWYIDITYW